MKNLPDWFHEAQDAIDSWVCDQFTVAVTVLWDDIYSFENTLTGKIETVIPVHTLDGLADRLEVCYRGTVYELLVELARMEAI